VERLLLAGRTSPFCFLFIASCDPGVELKLSDKNRHRQHTHLRVTQLFQQTLFTSLKHFIILYMRANDTLFPENIGNLSFQLLLMYLLYRSLLQNHLLHDWTLCIYKNCNKNYRFLVSHRECLALVALNEVGEGLKMAFRLQQ
jgi:hypothetical protein